MVLLSVVVAAASFHSIVLAAVIPSNCTATYLVEPYDTCVLIVDKFQNFTAPDLYRWNPEIGTSCSGLIAYAPVCINVPPYTYPGPIQAGAIFTADQTPVPRQPDIVSECAKFEYTDNDGNPSLTEILRENGLSKTQWNLWNWKSEDPSKDLYNWRGYFSCVGV